MKLFAFQTGGFGKWLAPETDDEILDRLGRLDQENLSKAQLNQLLAFGHEAPFSDAFFTYYWLSVPKEHPYDVTTIPFFETEWSESLAIMSLAHLKWGLYRLYIDGLMWVVNVGAAYRQFRSMKTEELVAYFSERRFNSQLIKNRGPSLPLTQIPIDQRFLISEQACKSYGGYPDSPGELKDALLEAWRAHRGGRGARITIRNLLEGDFIKKEFFERQGEFIFSADDVLEEPIESEEDIDSKYRAAAVKFFRARNSGLNNTRMYLSMVGELDVYVATSMRTREDFRDMARTCDTVFSDVRLKDLCLRHFNPTLSAAEGH